MRLRIRDFRDLTEAERLQFEDDNFMWATDAEQSQSAVDRWLVTLENKKMVIGFLVPKAEAMEMAEAE
jgi:hypothetical protein